ncbi:MAG: hypothetical protein KDC39_11510 [Actinobacteria bacterium]|nr:hypothetical protein [Actinomycetota bacterium]
MRTTGVTRRIVSIVSASALALGTVAVAAGAATAQEPDDSATVTAAAGGIKVKWDWTMPTFMKDTKTFVPTQDVNDPDFWSGGSYVAGPDGITDAKMKQASWYKKSGNALYGKVPKNGRFKVALDASGSSGGSGKLTCAWRIEADKTYKKRSNCSSSTSIMLPEGRHPLWLTVTDADGHSKTVASRIKVQNTLVVIVGDSYASGEGIPPFTNPDLRSDPNKRQVAWDYGECNRSRWGGFVRAAQAIESADARSNVTLVDVACGGAEVRKGWLYNVLGNYPTGGILYPQLHIPYDGLTPTPTTYAPPQVDQVNAMTRGSTIDTMFLSIGGNDAGLSEVAGTCATTPVTENCYAIRPNLQDLPPGDQVLWELTDDNLVFLEESYDMMAPCFTGDGSCKTWKVKGTDIATKKTRSAPMALGRSRDVVHAMYPDLTTVEKNGALEPCTFSLTGSPMNQTDNTWAWEQLYVGESGKTITIASFPGDAPPDPAQITPQGNGLLNLVERNRDKYGYTAATSMLWKSRGHGVCAEDEAWEYGTGVVLLPVDKVFNRAAALHPNDLGQPQYEQMLSRIGEKRAGVPVSKPATHVVSRHGLG